MELKKSLSDIHDALKGIIKIEKDKVVVQDANKLRNTADWLVYNAVFNSDKEIKANCRWIIKSAASAMGIQSASIQGLYEAMGRGEV
ncbi:MAG: aldolase, partial [Deltaproteobacteria bacterium]|nr:aldolase [Deltaproteobacteria bacterium]